MFRGIGDARTPLFTVMLACVINIGGDLRWWRAFTWAPGPAPALATVAAQAVSVVVSLAVIRRRKDRLPLPLLPAERPL